MDNKKIRRANVAFNIVGGLSIRDTAKAVKISQGTVYNDILFCVKINWLEQNYEEKTQLIEGLSKKGKKIISTQKINAKKAKYGIGIAYNQVLEILNIKKGGAVQECSILPFFEPMRAHNIQYDTDILEFRGRGGILNYLKNLSGYWYKGYKKCRGTYYFYRRERIRAIDGLMAYADILFVWSEKRQWFRIFLPDLPYLPGEEPDNNLLVEWVKREINFIKSRIVGDLSLVIDNYSKPISKKEFALSLRFFDIFNYKDSIIIDMEGGFEAVIDRSKGYSEMDIKNNLEARNAAETLFKLPQQNKDNISLINSELSEIKELLRQSIELQKISNDNILSLVNVIQGIKADNEVKSLGIELNGYS